MAKYSAAVIMARYPDLVRRAMAHAGGGTVGRASMPVPGGMLSVQITPSTKSKDLFRVESLEPGDNGVTFEVDRNLNLRKR